MLFLLSLLMLLPFTESRADFFDPGNNRGKATFRFISPEGAEELCIQMKPFPGLEYDAKLLKREAKLCKLDFYAADTAICSKNYRTDPGVNIYGLPEGFTREVFERDQCPLEKPQLGKKEGSFRQTITCDYAPAILAYFHISQFFGGAGIVEPAVIRTMDIREHRKVTAAGIAATKSPGQSDIHRAWLNFQSIEADVPGFARKQPTRAAQLFTKDLSQYYGAIEENVPGATKDTPINHVGGINAFLSTPNFQALTGLSSFSTLAPTLNMATVQTMVEAKDITDMLVMDYLLNQQDRFGNIQYLPLYVFQDQGGELHKELKIHAKALKPGENPSEKQKEAAQQESDMKARNAVLVKQILLKANECAITKDNLVKINHVMEKVAHIDPATYRRALDFDRAVQQSEVQAFLEAEVLLTKADIKEIAANAHSLALLLRSRCQAGKLRLDLDLASLLKGKALPEDTRHLCD